MQNILCYSIVPKGPKLSHKQNAKVIVDLIDLEQHIAIYKHKPYHHGKLMDHPHI